MTIEPISESAMDFKPESDPSLLRLIAAHPLLFRGQAPAVWSHVTTGWYSLIDKLCSDIETAVGPDVCRQLEVRQIKEKFGTLRFYYRLGPRRNLHMDVMSPAGRLHLVGRKGSANGHLGEKEARVRELVSAACAASEAACEKCGASAQLRDLGGWVTTLCDEHLAEVQARRSRRSS